MIVEKHFFSFLTLVLFMAILPGATYSQENPITVFNGGPTLTYTSLTKSVKAKNKNPILVPADGILYSQISPWNGDLETAQEFPDASADANVADDFTIPGGETWEINIVRWVGGYMSLYGPLQSINIAFYYDDSGSPQEPAIAGTSFNISEYSFQDDLFTVELPAAVVLSGGETYWISIQGVMSYTYGQYGFGPVNNSDPINNPMHRKDIDGYWGWTPTNTWVPVTDPSIGNDSDFDMCFELLDQIPQPPVLSIDPPSPFDFGNVGVNMGTSQTFTLENSGGGEINISDVSLDPGSDPCFSISGLSALPASLPPSTVTFDLDFLPLTTGTFYATIHVTSDLSDEVTTIEVTGKGVIPPPNNNCEDALSVTGPYPQLVAGTTINASPSCVFENNTVWYAVDLPYDLNYVTLSYCPTPDNGGSEIFSLNSPRLYEDCSCTSYYNFENDYTFTCYSGNIAPSFTYIEIPGPAIYYLPVGFPDEMDFEFEIDVTGTFPLELTVFLQGPYQSAEKSGMMSTGLNGNGLIPTSQPYNVSLPYYGNPMPDWFYTGAGSVVNIPNLSIVDWIILQLRQADIPGNASSATTLVTEAMFLLDDGSVVSRDGKTRPVLYAKPDPANSIYCIVYHRNHLGIMSGNALTAFEGLFTYDFSSGPGQVFGGISGYNELEPGIWGMVAGDGNGDGQINVNDKQDVWNLFAGEKGYHAGDFDMDSQAGNEDKNQSWFPNNQSKSSQIPN